MRITQKLDYNAENALFSADGYPKGAKNWRLVCAIGAAALFVILTCLMLIMMNDSQSTFGSVFAVFLESPIIIIAFSLLYLLDIALIISIAVFSRSIKQRSKINFVITDSEVIGYRKGRYYHIAFMEIQQFKSNKFDLLGKISGATQYLKGLNAGRIRIITGVETYSFLCSNLNDAVQLLKDRCNFGDVFSEKIF